MWFILYLVTVTEFAKSLVSGQVGPATFFYLEGEYTKTKFGNKRSGFSVIDFVKVI